MLIRPIVMINLQYILVSNHYCTPETNMMLYVNYISILKKKEKIYEDAWHNSGRRVCAQLMLVIVIIYVKY